MNVFGKGKYSGKVIDMISEDGVISSITFYDDTAFNNAIHYHRNAHISYVLSGGCIERKKQSYERTPGKITFYNPGEPHQVVDVASYSRHINIEIEQDFFYRNAISDSMSNLAIIKNPDAKFLMLKIYKEFIAGDQFSSQSIQMLLIDLMQHAKNLKFENRPPGWVKSLEELLHDNWNKKITLHELSLVANIHPVTISKYFPKYFSCTLGEYLRKIRIEKSLDMIKTSNGSLTAIAYECGFADQSHFIRTFKELTGFLPSVYQKS